METRSKRRRDGSPSISRKSTSRKKARSDSSSSRSRSNHSHRKSRSRRHKKSSRSSSRRRHRLSSTRNGQTVFFAQSHVYLASSDRMDLIHSNGRRIESLNLPQIDTYATVIGGFSGLNYLMDLAPTRRIILFDVNPYSVEYCKLIVELVRISSSHSDFISRVFNRSVTSFTTETSQELCCKNQETYLARKFEPSILVDTLSKLSSDCKDLYETYIMPFLHSHILPKQKAKSNCARLLPCWEYGKYVPVSAGGSHRRDWDGQGEGKLVPNTNTFHYGEGWLQSSEAFVRVRRLLEQCEVSLLTLDILSEDIHRTLEPDFSTPIVMHISNIDDFFVRKWNKRMKALKTDIIKKGGSLTIISATNGVRHFSRTKDVNLKAYDF